MKVFILCLVLILLFGHLHGSDEAQQSRDNVLPSPSSNVKAIRRFVVLNRDKFDQQDVADLLQGPNWHIKRFADLLTGQKNNLQLNEVLKLIGGNLLWRASIKLRSWKPEDFACEFWLAGFTQLTRDRQNSPVAVVDLRTLGSYSGGLQTAWVTFQYYGLDYVDRLAGNNETHWKLITGLSDVGLRNLADIKGIITDFAPLVDRFANSLIGIYLMDLPPLLEVAVRMIISLSSPRTHDILKVSQDKERFFVVKKRDMPERMGGRLSMGKSLLMVQFPKLLTDCVPLREMARRKGWSGESVKEFLDNTQHLIDYNAQQLNFTKIL